MAIDLSALNPFTITAANLGGITLVNPQNNRGIQAQNSPVASGSLPAANQNPIFMFDIEGDQSFNLESDITDHYLENNTSVQDQIALRPETFVVNGYVGELTDIAPSILSVAKLAADRLLPLSAYAPALSAAALIAYNQALLVYETANQLVGTGIAAWNTISGSSTTPPQTQQQTKFNQFYGYWLSKTLFTVQTPWNVMSDMAIQSLRAVQNSDTDSFTDFEITFKKMRFTQTVVTPSTQTASGRAGNQGASLVNNGVTQPLGGSSIPSLNTLLKSSFGGVFK